MKTFKGLAMLILAYIFTMTTSALGRREAAGSVCCLQRAAGLVRGNQLARGSRSGALGLAGRQMAQGCSMTYAEADALATDKAFDLGLAVREQ